VDLFYWNTASFFIHSAVDMAFQIEKSSVMEQLNSKIPDGPLSQKSTRFKSSAKLVNPANKKKLEIIIVGTGLSGASAASALG